MNRDEQAFPITVRILIAVTIAVAAMVAAVLLLGGDQALGEGKDTLTECTNADHTGESAPFTAPTGEIVTGVCIKSGSDTFAGGLQHSGLIIADGLYGTDDCFVVSGIGTSTVSVTLNSQASGCNAVSHIDINTGPEPTPTPTPTATATATVPAEVTPAATPTVTAAVLGEIQGPTSLPDTGGAPEEATVSSLSLLLGIAGLALLSGTGTLVAVAARRRR